MKVDAIELGLAVAVAAAILIGCTNPAKVEITPKKLVLEGAGTTQKLEAKVYDEEGKQLTEGRDIVWFSDDTKIIKLNQNGEVMAIASGEAEVEVEVVGTEIRSAVPVRVKIPASIKTSHDKLRLWIGQVKENVWAEVRSEKDAFVEGYLPEWSSEDSSIVKVEPIKDPARRQSWVKMTGIKTGTTYITAKFQSIAKTIRVAVFGEDEEILPDGTRIKKKVEDEEKEKDGEKKKKKGR